MNNYKLVIVSKKKDSINKFLTFLLKNTDQNFNLTSKYLNRKNKKNVLTILKSPHVNKTAQEQFESKTFSIQICFLINYNLKELIFIKKIKNTLFSDIQIKIKQMFR
jgi:ribosomal protein S10